MKNKNDIASIALKDTRAAMELYSTSGGGALNMVEIVQELFATQKACSELLSHATAMANRRDGAVESFIYRDHNPAMKWGEET